MYILPDYNSHREEKEEVAPFETTSVSSFIKSLLEPPTPAIPLLPRQATTTIVTTPPTQSQQTQPITSNCAGQYSGGVLAGAILGTFFGTLLLVYLFSTIRAGGCGGREEEVVIEKRVRSRSSGKRSSRRSHN